MSIFVHDLSHNKEYRKSNNLKGSKWVADIFFYFDYRRVWDTRYYFFWRIVLPLRQSNRQTCSTNFFFEEILKKSQICNMYNEHFCYHVNSHSCRNYKLKALAEIDIKSFLAYLCTCTCFLLDHFEMVSFVKPYVHNILETTSKKRGWKISYISKLSKNSYAFNHSWKYRLIHINTLFVAQDHQDSTYSCSWSWGYLRLKSIL
jgi:hypothetical protein